MVRRASDGNVRMITIHWSTRWFETDAQAINNTSVFNHNDLFFTWYDERGTVASETARLRRQFDVGVGEGLGHHVNFLDGIINSARENRFPNSYHAVHLVTVTAATNAIVLASGHIPASDESIVRAGVKSVTVTVHSQDSDRFIMTLHIQYTYKAIGNSSKLIQNYTL